MLTKVLFTLAVILVVALVFRTKSKPPKAVTAAPPAKGGISAGMVAYSLLGLVIAISALVFVLHWQDQHRIINIRITDSQGATLSFQAYKKAVEGRRFTTIDGRAIDLADSDRIEILEKED
ncbi:MAG: hypothetical protein CL395_07020 [Acidiferrobacteraceae bacterium]|jgi:hypothetical protein|nr:hypothetical protein [Acidiferrobacteraceae bacterium]MCP4828441.1 hypothetical protein [Pseudomonadota bacterium]HJP08273.1 hypothetical protein [Arenicellales bacterium]|tara:strand:- start:3533 stop:3895 length:363 start_codon:yes stop_codon:yes gene_type:complete